VDKSPPTVTTIHVVVKSIDYDPETGTGDLSFTIR
jgi:hypothetical protein